mgnify:CR=1 FL=1
MELFTREDGRTERDMEKAYRYGQMGQDMKEIGTGIKHMVKANSGM